MSIAYIKLAGSVVGAAALTLGAAGIVVGADTAQANESTPVPVAQNASETTSSILAGAQEIRTVSADEVSGTFAYDQWVLTPTKSISEVFLKAASTLCTSMPNYGIGMLQNALTIGGNAADQSFTATVSEMASKEQTSSYVMACACASNIAGGGAVANAEVSGVSLESIMNLAGAR